MAGDGSEHAGDEQVGPGDDEEDGEKDGGAPAGLDDPIVAANGGERGVLADHLSELTAPAADGGGAGDDAEEDEDATGDGEKGDEGEEEIVARIGGEDVAFPMSDGEGGEEEGLGGEEPVDACAGEGILVSDLVADGLVGREIDVAGLGRGHWL